MNKEKKRLHESKYHVAVLRLVKIVNSIEHKVIIK